MGKINAPASKPVKLQVNQSGAWRNVVAFNAADKFAADEVCDVAERIGGALPGTTFRVVIDDGSPSPTTLLHWSAETGWKERG